METRRDIYQAEIRGVFKSYYVVWKQEDMCYEKKVCVCLNRTMQYGNGDVDTYFRHILTV